MQQKVSARAEGLDARERTEGPFERDRRRRTGNAIEPGFAAFRARHEAGLNQVLYTTLVADVDTPVSLMLRLTGAGRDSFLQESVTGGEVRGRYSVIGTRPDLVWRCRDGRAEINRIARWDREGFEPEAVAPLESLRALLGECAMTLPEGLPAMASGLFGYFGYDMVRLVERLPEPNPDPLGLPDAVLLRPTLLAVVDSVADRVTLVAPVWASPREPARTAYARAAERLSDALDALDRPLPAERRVGRGAEGTGGGPKAVSNTGDDAYRTMVARAKDYIEAGDIFQAVLSQRWAVPFEQPPFALYRALRRTNPSPYMFHFDFGDFAVTGASPETLVRVSDGRVTIRPIAGTRPRGADRAEDAALEAELLADPKERAEHLMLLDLGRNDVGRVAEIGSVRPTETFAVERYSHVMHIVSNVEGRLSPEHDALSALLAGLPAGTVSGAPKIRAMEIIDELEREKRGIYAGGVGYFAANGDMDMCIALRTAVLKDGTMYVQAGGGVVHDSDAEGERRETEHKARALKAAATEALRLGHPQPNGE